MTFLYPLGLIGLVGVPILILVYIIKNKYTEQIVASTYLWKLSERFIKRRNPLSRLAGLISLILQLLLVTAISLAIAHPVVILEGEAREYCFVLDASGSMSMTDGTRTRFERGKDAIASYITSATDGSTYSLVYVGDETRTVYDRIEDKEDALLLLSELTPVHNDIVLTDAIGIAQGYFNDSPSTLTYLVTDKSYTAENITVVDVSASERNYALSGVTYQQSGAQLVLRGEAISYSGDATLTLGAYVDGGETAAATAEVSAVDGVFVPFEMRIDLRSFYSVEVRITDTDALAADNSVTLYSVSAENSYSVLLVSDLPFFIETALTSVSDRAEITVMETEAYERAGGYDLYIFDSFTPAVMPSDGAVWFFNPTASVSGSGFSVQGEYAPEEAVELTLPSYTSTMFRTLTENMRGDKVYVTEYVKCSLYDSFTSILEHKGNPVVFTGSNDHGNREVVFAFDLHKSNFTLTPDYVTLIDNLVDFSFPTVLDKTDYKCGETLSVNVIANCDAIIVTAPSGEVTYLDVSGTAGELVLTEAGIHEISVSIAGHEREYHIFSEFPETERLPDAEGGDLALLGEAGNSGMDGRYDVTSVLFILIAVFFTADWMVYCYEKYQLR